MDCNILFTCAGKRNYLLRYFKKALKGEGKIVAIDTHKYAAAAADADVFIQVPSINDEAYVLRLEEIIKAYNISAVISLNDLELPILSKHKKRLEVNGAKVLVSNEKVINTTFDKWETHQFLESIGVNSPKTYIDVKLALKDIEDGILSFPIILKPRFGSGSLGIETCESVEELKLAYKLQNIKTKRSIFNVNGDVETDSLIIIQQKLEGVEYGFDIINDFKGDFFASFLREKIAMRFGETDKAKSAINADFDVVGQNISKHLKHLGSLDGDAFLIGSKWYILELNPRFGGGYPFSHEAGADIAAVYIDWIKGKSNNLKRHIDYKVGIIHSKCDILVEL